MDLSKYFETTHNFCTTHDWILDLHKADEVSLNDLALAFADEIVKYRCRRCSQHYEAWKMKIENNTELESASKKALMAFLTPTFGEPEQKFKTGRLEHLEGFVSEWLWYFIILELSSEPIVFDIPPGFKSLDPGGDSLLIHRKENGDLLYRLWEIKKYSPRSVESSQGISQTVNRAYSQLKIKSLEYLARITSTEKELGNEELESFICSILDLWIDASPHASAGVSVSTSVEHAEKDCFVNFGEEFPDFVKPKRLLGVLTGIEDFSKFTLTVQKTIWKGL